MINDNRQAQRGSPLQRGPLLDPVQTNPNQPYTPVQGAGQGTVFQPGRTILGRNYATPKENPLNTLLGELPQVVQAISSTKEKYEDLRKKAEKERLLQAEETFYQAQGDLLSENPNPSLNDQRSLMEGRLRDFQQLYDKTKDPETRLLIIKEIQETDNILNGMRGLEKASNLADLRRDLDEEQRKVLTDPTRIANALNKSKLLLTKLEELRTERRTSGQDTSPIDEEINQVKNRIVGFAVSAADAEIQRIQMEHGPGSDEATEEVDKYIDGYSAFLEDQGYDEETRDLVMLGLSSQVTESALTSRNARQASFTANLTRVINGIETPDTTGVSLVDRLLDGSFTPENIAELTTINGRNVFQGQVVDSVLGAAGLNITEEVFREQGYNEADAINLAFAARQRVEEIVGRRIDASLEEYKRTKITQLDEQISEGYAAISSFAPSERRSYDNIVALELERNRLLYGTAQHRPTSEIVAQASNQILDLLTSNPAMIAQVQTGGLQGSKLSEEILRAMGVERRGPGDPPPSELDINFSVPGIPSAEGRQVSHIRQGSLAYHLYQSAYRNAITENKEDAAKSTIQGFLNRVQGALLTQAAREEERVVENASNITRVGESAGSVDEFNIDAVTNMSIEDALTSVIHTAYQTGNVDQLPTRFQRSNVNDAIAEYRNYAVAGGSELVIDENLGPLLGLLNGQLTNGRFSGGSVHRTVPTGLESTLGFPPKVFKWLSDNFTTNFEAFVSAEDPTARNIAFSRLGILTEALRGSVTGMSPTTLRRIGDAINRGDSANSKRLWQFLEPLIVSENPTSLALFDDPENLDTYFKLTLEKENHVLNAGAANEAEVRRRLHVNYGTDYTFEDFKEGVGSKFNTENAVIASVVTARMGGVGANQLPKVYAMVESLREEYPRVFDMSAAVVTMATNPTPITMGEAFAQQLYQNFDVYTVYREGEQQVEIVPPTAQITDTGVMDADFAPSSTVESWSSAVKGSWYQNWGANPLRVVGLVSPSVFGRSDAKDLFVTLGLKPLTTVDQAGVAIDVSPPSGAKSTQAYRTGVERSLAFGSSYMVSRLSEDFNLDTDQTNALEFRVSQIIERNMQQHFESNALLYETRNNILKELSGVLKEFDIPEEIDDVAVRYSPLNPEPGFTMVSPPVNDLTKLMRRQGLIPLGYTIATSDTTYRSGVNHPYLGGFYTAPNVDMDWNKSVDKFMRTKQLEQQQKRGGLSYRNSLLPKV